MKIVPEPDRLDARVPLGILAVSLVTLLAGGILTVLVRWSVPVSQAASARPITAQILPSPAIERSSGRALQPPEPHVAYANGLFERHAQPLPTREPPERLSSYGWVDRDRRIVHIPIERAKQLYLARQHSGKAGETLPVSQREGHER